MPEPKPETLTVYVSIGNSDDKLGQQVWSNFAHQVHAEIAARATQIHGVWYSATDSPYQNMCIAFEIQPFKVNDLRTRLALAAKAFVQDSILWAVAPVLEFIGPDEAMDRG